MNRKNIDILSGPLHKTMIRFIVPVFLANIINLLFNAVDLIVVGQFCGSHAIAAVGSTSRIVNLSICLFLGFASGFGVVLSHAIGVGDQKRISRIINTLIPFCLILGIILTVFGLLSSKWLLKCINTPADIIDDAALYLKIYFSGAILRLSMAFVCEALRAAGDAKTPMMCLTLGGIMNIGFNLFFVLSLGMTVDGVAYGTVISEGIASVLGIIVLMRRKDAVKISFKKMRLDLGTVKSTAQIGIPAGLQTGMFSLSTIVLTSAVNTLGTTVIAANSAALNVDEIIFNSVATAYASAVSVFTGQNYGAGNYERIKKITKIAVVSSTTVLIVLGVLASIFSRQLLSIYITDNPEAIEIGRIKMIISGGLYFLSAYRNNITAAMKGLGDTKRPLFVSIITTCLLKVVWVYTVFRIPACHNYVWLAVSYPVSWVLDGIVNSIMLKKDWKRFNINRKKPIKK